MKYKIKYGTYDSHNFIIDYASTKEEAIQKVMDYLKEKNFKSYYYRFNFYKKWVVLDFGSHINFIFIDARLFN